MIRSVFVKTLYDKRLFILGWSIGMFTIAVLMTSFYPAMKPSGGMDDLLKNMPAAFQGFVGQLDDLRHFDTYIAAQLFDIRVPIIVGIMAIILGLGLSTREEEDGELRTLVALPISRTRLFWQKWLAMALIMDVTVGALILGVYLIMPFVDGATIALGDMWNLAYMTWLVMVAFGSVAFAAGIASGKRAVASLIGISVIIGSFLLSTFAAAVDWLKDYEFLSLLHYFPAADIVRNGVEIRDVAVLSSVTLLSLIIGWFFFRWRDIG